MGRLLSFSGLSLLASLVPLIVLPVVARVGGEAAWATLGVGQAIGSLVGVFASLSWAVVGPAKIALNPGILRRAEIYASSFWSRYIAFVIAATAGCAVGVSLTPDGQELLVILMTLMAGLSGLSLSWISVGAGTPKILALYEVTPRVLASTAALILVGLSKNVLLYPVLMIVATLTGILLYHLVTFRRIIPPWVGWRTVVGDMRDDLAATGVNFVGSGYSVVPVPVAASMSSIAETASFSSADRLYRYSLFTITSLANALQPWVLSAAASESLKKRQNIAAASHVVLGVSGGLAMALLGVPVSVLLFGEALAASGQVMACYGIAFAAVCISTPYIRNVLVPQGNSRLVLVATLGGVLCGIATLFVLPNLLGLLGVALSLAVSDLVTMTLIICMACKTNEVTRGSFSQPSSSGEGGPRHMKR